MGKGFYSMITSVVRQLVFLIPCAWLFGKLFGLNAVWFSFLAAEAVALVLTLCFFRREVRRLSF